jgi:hypothetical protein
MKKITLSLLLLTVCLAGCRNRGTDGGLPTIDVGAAIDNRQTFDLAEIADKIAFIPLDDSADESLIGNIAGIRESQSRFYIQDRGNPVKIFDKTGKFVSTRGIIGRGPNEFLSINYLAVDNGTDNLYLIGNAGSGLCLLAYDAAGKIIDRAEPVNASNMALLVNASNMAFYEDRVILLNPPKFDVDPDAESTVGTRVPLLELFSPELQREGTVDVTDKGTGGAIFIESSGGNITGIRVNRGSSGILSDNGKTLTVKEERSDTVFHYRAGALEPAGVLRWGDHAIPPEAFGLNPTHTPSDGYLAQKLLESDGYLFVEAREYVTDATVQLVFERSDPAGGFSAVGPQRQNGLFIDGIGFTPMYIRDNRLVGYMNAIDIVDNADAITNPDLKAIADGITEDSNPVIVVATLKK